MVLIWGAPPPTQGDFSLFAQRKVHQKKALPRCRAVLPLRGFGTPAAPRDSCRGGQSPTSCGRPLRGAPPKPCGAQARHRGVERQTHPAQFASLIAPYMLRAKGKVLDVVPDTTSSTMFLICRNISEWYWVLFHLNLVSGQNNMATAKQELGAWGEMLVAKTFACPRCKTIHSLRRLPPNFKCADVICDFCGYLAQVKTASVKDVTKVPNMVLGAAWGPQKKRMKAGIYFPLFIVLRSKTKKAVFYLPTEFQNPDMFKKRKPLSQNARRAGWQGFMYDIASLVNGALVKIL